ncbi:MAG: PhoH family protein [Clostridia bacterium]|nr:PhoH family protein [Clostridia bacterium]
MIEKTFLTDSADQAMMIFGAYDANLSLIEDRFHVKVFNRDGVVVISGDEVGVKGAYDSLSYLKKLALLGEELTAQKTEYVLNMVEGGEGDSLDEMEKGCVLITSRGKPIKAKTVGQKQYVDKIQKNTVIFGVGPAGTGKTFLAVAMAVSALRRKEVARIVLTRPAVEAGEKLGYLPGDLQTKIDPYLRPLYDALFEMMGAEGYGRNMEKGIIEIAPLAYMRGRTLDDSFIILDEAQNTTSEQMKMFLTRLGVSSKAVITGDITQTDLPFGKESGLVEALKILEGIDDIAIHRFTEKDVVRHRLVQKIIMAYDKAGKDRSAKRTPGKVYRRKDQT